MWESKAESIDVNYTLEHVWFDGINGQHVQKPVDIRKWEESKVYKLIEILALNIGRSKDTGVNDKPLTGNFDK
jgi:hypothetical protein